MAFDVIFDSPEKAQDVLSAMQGIVHHRKNVTVGELYALIDHPSTYADYDQVWVDLSTVDIVQVGDGYSLKLPDPEILIFTDKEQTP